MAKWIFALFMLVVMYVGYTSFLKQDPAPPPAERAPRAVAEEPATTWERGYDTTFNYGRQVVRVSGVKVQNLDRTVADVSYTVVVTPSGPSKWLTRRDTWKLGRASSRRPATRVSRRRVDRNVAVFPRFRARTEQLERGSYLQIDIPQFDRRGRVRRTWPVRLGLEVPSDHRGIEERRGQEGF